ncbi:MAG: late competence development ComFB family protein [Xenococcaceae cyanobacterium]
MQIQNEQINRNIMEVLVAEEIERQINRYPDNIRQYLNRVEVATHALNRLPPLYASCHEGFNKQKLKGRTEHSAKITKTVRQAFAAVQKDLLRSSTPLVSEKIHESQEAKKALQELIDFLPHQEFSWEKLVKLIKPALVQLSHQGNLDIADAIRDSGFKSVSKSSTGWSTSVYSK